MIAVLRHTSERFFYSSFTIDKLIFIAIVATVLMWRFVNNEGGHMYLVMLMLFPLIIGIASMFWSTGRVTVKEFLVLEAASFAVVGIGFFAARWTSTTDWELWNGRVTSKKQVWVSCEHSYP